MRRTTSGQDRDVRYRPLVKSASQKLFFLFLIQNICCGYSKEMSQWDGFLITQSMWLIWWVRIFLQFYAAQKFCLSKPVWGIVLSKIDENRCKHTLSGADMWKNCAFYDKSMKLCTWPDQELSKFLRVSAKPEMHLDGRHLEFQNGDLFSCSAC